MRVISVINQKGGVGKTTTSVNLAHALALANYRVTMIDMDPQGHLTTSLGLQQNQQGIDSVLLENNDIGSVTCKVRERLNLVPAGCRLNDLEHLANGGASRGMLLQHAIEGHFDDQDFVIIDCPPSSGLLAINALFAGQEILVPVVGDYLALCGVSQLMQTLKRFESVAKKTMTTWFALTRFHPRGRLARDVMGKLQTYFPGRVLGTSIRETVAIAESPGHGKTIFEYSPNSNGAEDYRSLAEDLVHGRAM